MNPRVQAVVPDDDYQLKLVFTNGEIGLFDCKSLLTFGVFRELAYISYFKRVVVEHGTVAWPHEQDICPDTLYEKSTKLTSMCEESTQLIEPAVDPNASRKPSRMA